MFVESLTKNTGPPTCIHYCVHYFKNYEDVVQFLLSTCLFMVFVL